MFHNVFLDPGMTPRTLVSKKFLFFYISKYIFESEMYL